MRSINYDSHKRCEFDIFGTATCLCNDQYIFNETTENCALNIPQFSSTFEEIPVKD